MWFVAAAVFSFLAVIAVVQTTGIRELIPPLMLIPSLFGGLGGAGIEGKNGWGMSLV